MRRATVFYLLLACGGRATHVAEPRNGLVGMRYRALQEGLLVQEVVPGMGAEQAGVQPGDLVVAVEGQDVDDTAAVRARIMGEPGSFVRLEIEASWAGGTREIDVERGLPAGRSDRVGLAPEVERLRQSVIHERPARAARVMRSLVEQDPESWRSSVLRLLVRAASRTPEVVAAAAAVMVAADPDDLDALYLLGRSRAVQGDPIGTVEALSLVEAQRIPDVQGPDWKGDIGGMANLRSVLAMALWESGLSEEAIDMARQLLRSQDDPELAAALGLEQAGPSTFWNVSLAPAAPLQVQLLDGSSWSLADRDGVVLLAFWATWCEPCREELPELAKLWERHRGGGLEVLAVSLDDAGERADVERFARKLDLPFSVTHAPGLAGRFEVGGIPAVRLLGRSGHVQYRGQGYSPEGMQELETRVEQVLASPVDTPGTVLGQAWTSGQAHLEHFVAVPGLQGLTVSGGAVVLGIAGQEPVILVDPERAISAIEPADHPTGEARAPVDDSVQLVGWIGDGPVWATPGSRAVRGRSESEHWMVTTVAPITDLVSTGGQLWVATESAVGCIDTRGRVLGTSEGGAKGLAPDERVPGGVLAVDGERVRRLAMGAAGMTSEDLGAAADARAVTGRHHRGGAVVSQLVAGRFGPEGAVRVVAVRTDDVIVGLSGSGLPAFTLTLRGSPWLAVRDEDGDGKDELIIGVSGLGVGVVSLHLP